VIQFSDKIDDGPEIDREYEDWAKGMSQWWTEQSVLHFYDHQCAEHMIWAICNGQGATPSECGKYARQATLQQFKVNYVGWDEDILSTSIDHHVKVGR